MEDIEKRFNEAVPQLRVIIDRRRNTWQATSIMEWSDVSSILLTRIYEKFHLYDQEKPLDRWANTVVSNAIRNLLRDNIFKTSRPCISASSYGAACTFNTGGDGCSFTPSGKQCAECKFYARWEKKKQAKHAIAAPVSLENHLNESHNQHSDFMDVESAKKIIDEKIMEMLDNEERKIYRLLHIKNLEMEEVGKKMGYKKQKNSDIPGYIILKAAEERFYQLARTIIEEEGLVR